MVHIPMLCSSLNFFKEGILAIVPSSFIISHITPAGVSPASLAISTEPSVCPALTITPPSFARSGKMCPGLVRSDGFASFFMAVNTVVALSAADIPVVTPSLASIETVNPVSKGDVLLLTIIGSCRASVFSPVNERHINPLAYLAMKLMISVVTFSAAIVRLSLNSRSSSSTRITF